MNSGNEYLDILSYDTPHSNFTFMAGQFGCGDLEPTEELACMRTVNADDIADFLHGYIDNGTTPTVSFAPITDEKTVFSDFYDRAINGNVAALVSCLPCGCCRLAHCNISSLPSWDPAGKMAYHSFLTALTE